MAENEHGKPTGAYVAKDIVTNEVTNMKRGTTPTHVFTLPFEVNLIEKVMVIYAQNNVEVIKKEKEDCEMNGRQVSVTLSQEETLRLSQTANVEVQIRILTNKGNALASQVFVHRVGACLNNEVV